MSEGRHRVPLEDLITQWDEALDENRRIMEPIIGGVALDGTSEPPSWERLFPHDDWPPDAA